MDPTWIPKACGPGAEHGNPSAMTKVCSHFESSQCVLPVSGTPLIGEPDQSAMAALALLALFACSQGASAGNSSDVIASSGFEVAGALSTAIGAPLGAASPVHEPVHSEGQSALLAVAGGGVAPAPLLLVGNTSIAALKALSAVQAGSSSQLRGSDCPSGTSCCFGVWALNFGTYAGFGDGFYGGKSSSLETTQRECDQNPRCLAVTCSRRTGLCQQRGTSTLYTSCGEDTYTYAR